MKFLVIGHSVEDIIHAGGSEIVKPGGIYYSVLALLKIISKHDEIHLITALQKDKYNLFSDIYESIIKNEDCWVEEIPRVHLFVHEKGERTECFESIPKNLNINFLTLHEFEGILINMISGFDITLKQLNQIRRNFHGLIYFDVHSFSRGVDKNKTRVFRVIDNFDEWTKQLDIIQVNELEVNSLFGCENDYETAKKVLSYGVRCLIVTRGELGARVYSKRKNEIESIFLSAEKVEAINKVGCGDIFGAVFFYSYLKSQDIYKSLYYANHAAAKSVTVNIMTELSFH